MTMEAEEAEIRRDAAAMGADRVSEEVVQGYALAATMPRPDVEVGSDSTPVMMRMAAQ